MHSMLVQRLNANNESEQVQIEQLQSVRARLLFPQKHELESAHAIPWSRSTTFAAVDQLRNMWQTQKHRSLPSTDQGSDVIMEKQISKVNQTTKAISNRAKLSYKLEPTPGWYSASAQL